MTVVDVHAHLTPERFRNAVAGGGTWHGMTAADGELENPKNLWPAERRIAEMDELGVDVQLVSATDVFYQYDREPEVTARIAAECNEEVGELVRAHPDRFLGLGTVPMQEPALAVAELRRAVTELGLSGVMVDDHVNGQMYDEEQFRPFWAAAEELGAFVLVHQFWPTSVALRTEKYFLFNSVGNLADRTLTFGALVFGGVMDDFPGLKVCLAHAGGFVPYALDRMDKGWLKFPDSRGRSRDLPSTYAGRFYYDTVVFTDRNLRFLIDTVGIDRMLFGTDWPAPMDVDDPVRRIERSPALAADEREAILRRNAADVLSPRASGAGRAP